MGKMTQFALHLSIVGCIIVFVSILAMCDYFQPGHTITDTGGNRTGWPSGIAWILGIGNALYAYGGTDAVIHIAEEVTHPGKRLPQVM
jgi:choline transport protein